MNSNCSNFLDMKSLHEQVKKAFYCQKLFWPFTVWINCSRDLKNFANFRPSASNFNFFSITRTILLKNTICFSRCSNSRWVWRARCWRQNCCCPVGKDYRETFIGHMSWTSMCCYWICSQCPWKRKCPFHWIWSWHSSSSGNFLTHDICLST